MRASRRRRGRRGGGRRGASARRACTSWPTGSFAQCSARPCTTRSCAPSSRASSLVRRRPRGAAPAPAASQRRGPERGARADDGRRVKPAVNLAQPFCDLARPPRRAGSRRRRCARRGRGGGRGGRGRRGRAAVVIGGVSFGPNIGSSGAMPCSGAEDERSSTRSSRRGASPAPSRPTEPHGLCPACWRDTHFIAGTACRALRRAADRRGGGGGRLRELPAPPAGLGPRRGGDHLRRRGAARWCWR